MVNPVSVVPEQLRLMHTATRSLLPLLRRLYRSFRAIPPVRYLLDVSGEFYQAEVHLHRRVNS